MYTAKDPENGVKCSNILRGILQNIPKVGWNEVVAKTTNYARLASLASGQWGLITRPQMQAIGIPATTISRLTAGQGAILENVATGVYRLAGVPIPDNMELLAAWMQLAPDSPVWERTADQGIASHRSAASILNLGDLPADKYEFTLPIRKQTRRPDVRLHKGRIEDGDYINVRGLLTSHPTRIAADLLRDDEAPEAVSRILSEAITRLGVLPADFAKAIAPSAFRFGFRRHDGFGLLGWLFDATTEPRKAEWLLQAAQGASLGVGAAAN